MQDRLVRSLTRAISTSRFGPYGEAGASNDEQFAHYLWNMALCESLYPALQCLEVTLRNSIDDSAATAFNDPDWYESVLVERERVHVARAKARLEIIGKVPSADDIVATLSLGFWVNLFYRSYEQILWPRLLVEVFPYLSSRLRTRQNISRRLVPIRNLRNRVFHHEPIWYWQNLQDCHAEVLETIGWINPDMQIVAKTVDRFSDTYMHGLEKCRRDLQRIRDVSV